MPPPLNSTKMRFVAGTNDTGPLAVAKIAKVGVALALIVVENARRGGRRARADEGFVWHIVTASGRVVRASRSASWSDDVSAFDDPPFPSERFDPGRPL